MNKWLSRTFYLIIFILIISCVFLWTRRITDAVWAGVVSNIFLYWVGGDVINKWKNHGDKK